MPIIPSEIQPLVPRFIRRVKGANHTAPIKIYYHADPDGLCAGAAALFLIQALQPGTEISTSWIGTDQFDFAAIEGYLEHHRGSSVFCFDLNLSSRAGFLNYLKRHKNNTITVVDDHALTEFPVDLGGFLLNPNRDPKRSKQVSFAPSLFAYIAAKSVQLNIPSWVPAIGLFADRQLDLHKNLLEEPPPPTNELLDAGSLLSSAFLDPSFSNEDMIAINLLLTHIRDKSNWSAFLQDAKRDPALSMFQQRVQAALEREIDEQRLKGPVGNFDGRVPTLAYRQTSEFRFTNLVSSRLRNDLPNGVTIVYRSDNSICFFEIRLGQNVRDEDSVKVLRKVAQAVPLRNFGGHPRASGGACKCEYIDEMVRQYAAISHSDTP